MIIQTTYLWKLKKIIPKLILFNETYDKEGRSIMDSSKDQYIRYENSFIIIIDKSLYFKKYNNYKLNLSNLSFRNLNPGLLLSLKPGNLSLSTNSLISSLER